MKIFIFSNFNVTVDGKEFVSKKFTVFSNKSSIRRCTSYTSQGAVFAERFDRTIGGLLEKHTFEKSDDNSIDVLPTIPKQYNHRIHSSCELITIEASSEKNEGYVDHKLIHKRKSKKLKFETHNLGSTADLKQTLSKNDTTIW